MMLTTAQVAKVHRVTPRRILAIAKARGVKPALSTARFKLWSQDAVAVLKPGKPGRPTSPPGTR